MRGSAGMKQSTQQQQQRCVLSKRSLALVYFRGSLLNDENNIEGVCTIVRYWIRCMHRCCRCVWSEVCAPDKWNSLRPPFDCVRLAGMNYPLSLSIRRVRVRACACVLQHLHRSVASHLVLATRGVLSKPGPGTRTGSGSYRWLLELLHSY